MEGDGMHVWDIRFIIGSSIGLLSDDASTTAASTLTFPAFLAISTTGGSAAVGSGRTTGLLILRRSVRVAERREQIRNVLY